MSAANSAPDRRAVLGSSLALASAVAASAVPVQAGTAAHPDAALLQLVAAFLAAEAERTQISIDADAAFARYVAPPIPAALYHQPERDTFEICHDPRRADFVRMKASSGASSWWRLPACRSSSSPRASRCCCSGSTPTCRTEQPWASAHASTSWSPMAR